VNPVALQAKNEILATNERQVTILETENFGTLAFVEVGALCVGKIVQTHSDFSKFKRGDEKGYFLFGGSTVIVLGQPGKWKPEYDLLEQTQAGRETLVKLGADGGWVRRAVLNRARDIPALQGRSRRRWQSWRLPLRRWRSPPDRSTSRRSWMPSSG
jgi:hypothetical protein